MNKEEELRYRICECLGIFPEEIEHGLPANIGERVIRRLETLVEMHGDKKLIDELEFQKGWCSPDGIAQFDVAGIQHRIDTLRERSKLSTTKHNTSKE